MSRVWSLWKEAFESGVVVGSAQVRKGQDLEVQLCGGCMWLCSLPAWHIPETEAVFTPEEAHFVVVLLTSDYAILRHP